MFVSFLCLSRVDVADLTHCVAQTSGQYYNFSNIRYGQAPLGNLRFAAPLKPYTDRPVFNDGSRAVTCFQAVPAWTAFTTAWVTNGTSAFDISAGYQPPNVTELPPADPQASEDCLFLDLMVPKSIFDRAGRPGAGAPVYADRQLSARCN